MVLQETETQVQSALSDTILTTFQKTLKYQTEFSVEGLLRVVVDKKDIYTFNINERIEKGRDSEQSGEIPVSKSPTTKRKRGRPRRSESQKSQESESDEDNYDDDISGDIDESGSVKDEEKTQEETVKEEPIAFEMGAEGVQKAAEAGGQVFSQEDTALQQGP